MTGLFGRLLRGFCKGIVSTCHLAKKDHPAIYRMMCAGLVVYGIVLTLSFYNGSYWIADDQWKGFLQQPNWAGFVLFFPLLGLLTVSNWKSFENAWRRLPEKGVLQEMTYSGTQPLSSNGIQAIIDYLYGLRRRGVWRSWLRLHDARGKWTRSKVAAFLANLQRESLSMESKSLVSHFCRGLTCR